MRSRAARGGAFVRPSLSLLVRLPALVLVLLHLLHLLQPAAATALRHDAKPAVRPKNHANMEAPSTHSIHARDLPDTKQTSTNQVAAPPETGPRRRQQWDFVGPSLLLGGTLAALMLAAIGHLASKALLASMLSAALSAVQLARPPPPNRPG